MKAAQAPTPHDHSHDHDHEGHDHDHEGHTHEARAIPVSPDLPANTHLHCVACGKHLDTAGELRARGSRALGGNTWLSIRCAHGTEFYACNGCLPKARALLDEHDRTGRDVRAASAWH